MKSHVDQTRRSLFTTEAREPSVFCSPQFVGSVLILVGFFGPWVAHRTAALTVTGYELSEFAKFFPQVQGGTVPVMRSLFVSPLLATITSLALVIQRSRNSPQLRLGGTLLAALLGLIALPPFQAILEPQYRLQLILVGGGVLMTLLMPLARQLSEDVRGALLLSLTIIGAVPALWQALLLRPLVTALYGTPIWPGWGFVVCTAGFLILLFAGLRSIFRA
jgi:hypothetical protein